MKQFVLLASLLVSTSVFANDVDPAGFEKEHFNASMTRADALAQAKRALAPSIKIDDQGRAITAPSAKPPKRSARTQAKMEKPQLDLL